MADIKTFPNWLYGKESWNNNWQCSWNTTVQTSASGRSRTLTNQLYPNRTTYIYFPHLTDVQADDLEGFINSLQGGSKSFWFKDFSRHKMKDQVLARSSDGTYQCIMKFGEAIEPVYRVENLKLFVNGTELTSSSYTLEGGKITIPSTNINSTVIASYDYYFLMRVKDDAITVRRNFINSNNVSLNLEVVR
jgi:hypothetical protein